MKPMGRRPEKPAGPVSSQFADLPSLVVVAFFLALPAFLFYAILFRNALDVPSFDDYGLLLFLNRFTVLQSISAKTIYFLASQHNEYKLFFGRGLGWIQLRLCGHVDFKMLCVISNGFVALLALLLWKMFLPTHKNLTTRLAFFIPVSWLLFQLEYWETLNWAFPGLQNIPVLFFSLGAIYLLLREKKWAFSTALAFLVLAVAASGNGFLVIPIGILILGRDHKYARVSIWLAVSAGCIAAYAYRYNSSHVVEGHHSFLLASLWMKPAYVVAFVGSGGGLPFQAGSFFLGFLLCSFFVWMVFRGYIRKNPLVSYCVLFLLLTAIGVAGIRSDLGVMQSLQSRYTIYCALFLIFAWFAIVEEFLQFKGGSLLNNAIFLSAVVSAVLFSLFMDEVGLLMIHARSRATVQAMAAFEHSSASGFTVGPMPPSSSPERNAKWDALNLGARDILLESIRLGIYRPPAY